MKPEYKLSRNIQAFDFFICVFVSNLIFSEGVLYYRLSFLGQHWQSQADLYKRLMVEVNLKIQFINSLTSSQQL